MNVGHGNHWVCLQKPVEDAIRHFTPSTLARGKVQDSMRRKGLWFDRDRPSEEAVTSITMGENEAGIEISFFDTHYFANRDRYRVGKSYRPLN